ncbi:hypothetical protein [Desulfoscipio sp. XC116]|uniref:hypothetical protein n=1 Tax=Desulfoscipio sp. XC116 TaxID=3144975 RepID=UPI00325B2521
MKDVTATLHINSLLILNLDTALKLCRSAGRRVDVEFTSPPRGELTGQYRVIRSRELSEGSVMLTVAREKLA